MKALVIYESMFGNTREVAQQIADGLGTHFDASVVPVAHATPEVVADADLVVVGGPTHVHGMVRARTRQAAMAMAEKEGSGLSLEPDALEPGLREWLESVALRKGVTAAAFDTRAHGPGFVTGRASRRIARRLRHRGARIVETKSFFVEKNVRLSDGEAERARVWGASLASCVRQPLMTA
jgi:flavodoxin